MANTVVFDIETYRRDWQVRKARSEDLDPEENTVITVGFFDGKDLSISPVIEGLEDEGKPVQFFLERLEMIEGSVLVGYNILHFDIPYLVHKSKATGKNVDIARFRPLDLFWILPYWLHNIPSGREFFKGVSYLGNIWSFENIVKHILREKSNPFTNKDIFELWEKRRFADIEKHLEVDLRYTFSFLNSAIMQETLNSIQGSRFERSYCKGVCPFHRLLQKTRESAYSYCTLFCEIMKGETQQTAIDVIVQDLPERSASWIPRCLP